MPHCAEVPDQDISKSGADHSRSRSCRKIAGLYARLPFGKAAARQCAMAQTLSAVFVRPLPDAAELLRSAVVIGCALALILAGPAFPSGL